MKRELTATQNALYNTVGSCFYLICQWLITVLVIRFGSVEEGGVLSLAMAVTTMFYTISSVGRPYQVSDYRKKYQTGEYVGTRFFTCGVAFILCVLYCFLYPGYVHYEILCIIVYMLFKTIEAISDEYQAIQQIANRMDYICVSFVVRGILLIISFTITLILTKRLLPAVIAMTVTTGAFVAIYDIPICKRLISYRLSFRISRSLRLLADNVPILINSLLMVVCVTIPRTFLNTYWGNYIMGIYGSISAPASIMQSVAVWLYLPFLPQFAELYNERKKRGFYALFFRVLLIMTGVIGLIMAGGAILGEWGLNLIYGEEIAKHHSLLIPTLLTTAMIAYEYYFSNLLTAIRKLKYIVIGNTAALLSVLFFAEKIVAQHGAMGVNYTIYISFGVNLCIQAVSFMICAYRWFRSGGLQDTDDKV